MKKTLAMLLALVMALSVSVIAFADAGGPMFVELDAYVSNPDGATVYNYSWDEGDEYSHLKKDGFLPYKTKVIARDEMVDNGVRYTSISYDDGEWGYLKVADISFNKTVFDPADGYKLEKEKKAVVINKNGIYLYAGPRESFDKTSDVIPQGTVFTYQYMDTTDGMWGYTNINGQSGWALVDQYEYNYCGNVIEGFNSQYSGKLVIVNASVRMFETIDDARAYVDDDSESTANFVGTSIPIGTQLAYKYYFDGYPVSAFVEYKGVKGWIIMNTNSYDKKSTTETGINDIVCAIHGNVPIYKDHSKSSGQYSEKLPEGTIVATDYKYNDFISAGIADEPYNGSYVSWYKITYKGITGWVLDTDDDDNVATSGWKSQVKLTKRADMHASLDEDSPVVASIAAGTRIEKAANEWYYDEKEEESYNWDLVFYDGKAGWVLNGEYDEWVDLDNDYSHFINYTEPVPETSETEPEQAESTEIQAPEFTEPESTTKVDVPTVEKQKNTVIYCVAAAAVLCLTAAIVIVLVNKKKKSVPDNQNFTQQ